MSDQQKNDERSVRARKAQNRAQVIAVLADAACTLRRLSGASNKTWPYTGATKEALGEIETLMIEWGDRDE